MAKQSSFDLDGIVTEALGNGMYRVQLDNGHVIIAHLSGKDIIINQIKNGIDKKQKAEQLYKLFRSIHITYIYY